MWTCKRCGGEAQYDRKAHIFRCKACGDTQAAEPVAATCFRCGKRYTKHTWFDPTGCDACHASFVD